MPTSVINQRLSLDRDSRKGYILEHICGLIWIYNVCGVKVERAWDLFHDIIILDSVTTCHFSQFQLLSAKGPSCWVGSCYGSTRNRTVATGHIR